MSFNENKKTISKATSSIKDNMKLRMIKILLYKSLYLKQKTISKGTYFIKSGNDPFTAEWGLPSIQPTNMYTNENQKKAQFFIEGFPKKSALVKEKQKIEQTKQTQVY